ncbi:MAG: hypothetical protein J6B71_10315 [Clostridia bacterium]|nr:hypothetical protein [Clostridia bacterium]MBO5295619.1 hypothetical protein [Clostridia bacterium]
MKKIAILLLACLALTACGSAPEEPLVGPPGDRVPSDTTPCAITTPAPTTPDVTSSRTDVPPLTGQVELLDGEGNVLPAYSELIWIMDGTLVGDGMLMFQSVSSRLPAIAAQIPSVTLNGVPTVRIVTNDTETARGGQAVSVYGEDYSQLANRISWEEVVSRGQTEWFGRTLYLYFSVTYSSTYSPDYTKEMSTAYFIKVQF